MAANRREYNKQETIRHIQAVFLTLYAQDGIFFAVFGSRRRLVRGVVTMPPVPPRPLPPNDA